MPVLILLCPITWGSTGINFRAPALLLLSVSSGLHSKKARYRTVSHCNADDSPIYWKTSLSNTDLGFMMDSELGEFIPSSPGSTLKQWSTPLLHQLDYCNALYFGVRQSFLSRLQLVKKTSAARLLTAACKSTLPMALLHWLPVHHRVSFKILLFVFKCLNILAPPPLSELLHPYSPARPDQMILVRHAKI